MKENSSLLKIFLWLGFFFLGEGIQFIEHNDENPVDRWKADRDPRLFRLRIPADNCQSVITGYNEGYCDGLASCLVNLGGIAGVCPSLLGICCVVKKSCGAHIVTRIAYFRNRRYPDTNSPVGVCSITIARYIEDVVQIRIDFLDFQIGSPVASGMNAGNCQTATELFTVTGGDARFVIPALCGINTGQHMYVNFATTGNITLNFRTGGIFPAKFNLKITQFRANHPDKAPDGCLQYFTTNTGTVTSFNYNNGNGQHINNQRYNICVRRIGPSSECVTWTLDSLRIAAAPTRNGDPCFTGMQDYINIPGGITGTTRINAYCSSNSNGLVVKSTSSKIEVLLNVSEAPEFGIDMVDSTLGTRGFQLSYSLGSSPCTT